MKKHDPAGRGSGNSGNESTRKTIETEMGPVVIGLPRVREGRFVSLLVPNGRCQLGA